MVNKEVVIMGISNTPRGKKIHGFTVKEHPLYGTWNGIKSRCYGSTSSNYSNYGGRGIRMCDRWRESFLNFALDMGLKPTANHSIERINNDGDYEPSNCKWATRTEQCVNRRKFKNNTTGFTGVIKVRDRYKASFDYENTSYNIGGTFKTAEDASNKRTEVLQVFEYDKERALSMCVRVARCDSTTGVKGVSRHPDGTGFIARYMSPIGKREYLGFFETIQDASDAIEKYKLTGEDSKDPIRRRTTSGVKGISVSKGVFLVKPYLDKKKHYVGRFKTLDEAKTALTKFLEDYKNGK